MFPYNFTNREHIFSYNIQPQTKIQDFNLNRKVTNHNTGEKNLDLSNCYNSKRKEESKLDLKDRNGGQKAIQKLSKKAKNFSHKHIGQLLQSVPSPSPSPLDTLAKTRNENTNNKKIHFKNRGKRNKRSPRNMIPKILTRIGIKTKLCSLFSTERLMFSGMRELI